MLSVLSLVTLSGFTLSSQVQLGLRAGVLGTSSSSDYPSLPPSARESRAGCFPSPAPAVPAQPRAAEESPLGEGILSPPSSWPGWGCMRRGQGPALVPLSHLSPCSTKAAAPALPQGRFGSPEHLGKAPSSPPTLEQNLSVLMELFHGQQQIPVLYNHSHLSRLLHRTSFSWISVYG